MKRHLARMANTDQRVIVVMMQIPGRLDYALVVPTDNLPPRWEQALMQVVQSPEGQGDPDLANVLQRRMMPDSTETILQAFHAGGVLNAVPIGNVIMFPEPNRPFALRQILQAMGRILPDEYEAAEALAEAAAAPPPPVKAPVQKPIGYDPYASNTPSPEAEAKFNPHTQNRAAVAADTNRGLANNLLVEADMLESEARNKRERAYGYAPSLRPAPVAPRRATAVVAQAPEPVAKKTAVKAPAKRAAPTRAKKA
jgi:hypothetical protein